MKTFSLSQQSRRLGVAIFIFGTAFLLRALYPVSRPDLWLERSVRFFHALLNQEWAATYQQYHPGVTVMWLTGTGLQLFSRIQGGVTPDQFYGSAPARPGLLNEATVAGVLPLALAIAFCITLTYFSLQRLAGFKIASVAGFFLAFDPFHITYSKVIHLDALLASLMFASAVFLLNFLHERRRQDLVFSGLFAGLSFLTKSPSVFLIPYAMLLAGVAALWPLVTHSQTNRRQWKRQARNFLLPLLAWGGVAFLIFVILWPAMWVKPIELLSEMASSVFLHTTTPHKNVVFFNGINWRDDPGLLFYLAIIAWKTTLLTLPLIAIAFILAPFRFKRHEGKFFGAFAAYAFFFTLQMGLGSKKQMAYIVPVFPALAVIAAFGWVWSAESVGRWLQSRQWPKALGLLTVAAMGVQTIVVVGHHPYYGTHHNRLLGGSPVAQYILPLQDQGEGLDLAARYLNTLPHGQDETAVIPDRNAYLFQQIFAGRVITEVVPADAPTYTYHVYDINQVTREFGNENWRRLWRADQQRDPLLTVAFDNVTYVWVYGDLPEDPAAGGPAYNVDYQLGQHIRLRQVRFNARTLARGDTLNVVLLWQSEGKINKSYKVFNHLLSATGELVAQRDDFPLSRIRPTQTWQIGETLEDTYRILLDEKLPPGEYELSVGMYDARTLERLAAYDAQGNRLPEDRIVIDRVVVVASRG